MNTENLQKLASLKSQVVERQSKTEGEIEDLGVITPILSNIDSTLNALAALAPKSEFFASNGIVTSLGYYVVNQLLWQHRSANSAIADTPIGDVCDDGFVYPESRTSSKDQFMIDAGMQELPRFNALPLVGVYKSLLRMQVGSVFAPDFPVTQPNEILARLITDQREEETRKAYEAMGNAEIGLSRAAAAIKTQMAARITARPVFTDRNKVEMAYVIDTLKKTAPEPLTDDMWAGIPIWVQYKFSMSVFNQVIKAITYETMIEPNGSYKRTELIKLSDELMLELEAANKHRDVRLAFALGRLSERHVLETVEPVVQAPAEAPKFQRAPAPTAH